MRKTQYSPMVEIPPEKRAPQPEIAHPRVHTVMQARDGVIEQWERESDPTRKKTLEEGIVSLSRLAKRNNWGNDLKR